MGDAEDVADILSKKLLDWERHLERVPIRSGARLANNVDRQINITKAYGIGTYLKDVTGFPNVPAAIERGPLVLSGGLYRTGKVYAPVGVSDGNPLPTMFWGTVLAVETLRLTAANTDTPFTAPTALRRYAKTAVVKTPVSNAAITFVRGDGVVITAGPPITGYPMGPGDVQVFPVKDLQNIHVWGAVGADVHILYVPDVEHT